MQQPIALITGASRGIGLATAKRFLEQGYRVINLSRSRPPLTAVEHHEVDLSDSTWIGRLELNLAYRSTLCLVHNASVMRKDSVRDAAADLTEVMQINLIAAQQLNERLLPHMAPGSSILYVGSTLSDKAVANTLSYSVSKHALLGLMRATCQDLAGSGIHSSAICPGFTDTEMLRSHLGHDQSILHSIEKGVSFGRLIKPEEIAETIWFCANNPVINGAVIHANLGQIES